VSFLKGLFGGAEAGEESQVRLWAKGKEREVKYSKNISPPEALFSAIIYGISSFSGPYSLIKGKSETKQYSGDAALFELTCYAYYTIDLWLFQNKPDRRDEISSQLGRQSIDLFAKVFSDEDVYKLFNHRLSNYGELTRSRADIKKFIFHLNQLIMRTNHNQLPDEVYDFKNPSVMLDFDSIGLEMALMGWYTSMIPALIQTVDNYCGMTE
jgi:hypothetical protein